MMKKRVVALTTAAVMALSMTACGGGGGADKTASGDKADCHFPLLLLSAQKFLYFSQMYETR